MNSLFLHLVVAVMTLLAQGHPHATTDHIRRLLRAECGRAGKSNPKELGGRPIQAKDYPWLAIVGFPKGNAFTIRCIGALVSSRYVLAGAKCFGTSSFTIPTHVRLGEYDISSNSDGATPRDYYIVDYVTPGFIKYTDENDITLIQLDRDVQYSDDIRPACLPYGLENVSFVDNKLFVVGWNTHKPSKALFGNNDMTIPFGEKFPVVDSSVCFNESLDSDRSITDKNICVHAGGGEKCVSRKEGPLHYYDGSTGKYMIVGLLSYAPTCREDQLPSVFTNVAKFLPWILKTLDNTN